jgi:hypothetical protein
MHCQDEGGTPVNQDIINLYDRFTHGGMSRRDFLDRLVELAGSTAAAVALLPLLQNDYARAAIVAADDARLAAERVSYDSPKGKINGYLVRGKAMGKRPVVVVIHENRGLNPHTVAPALRRERREHQQGHRGIRGGAEIQQQEIHDLHLSRHPARLQQRHRCRALQQSGG